jgi:membrane dipeptidase
VRTLRDNRSVANRTGLSDHPRVPVLEYVDHRNDPGAWADSLGISREAIDLYLASDVLDLHVDSFIWTRVFGYDLRERHGTGLFGARFYSQVDFPRILEAQLTGATWIITTNPIRASAERQVTFKKNLEELRSIFESVSSQFALVKSVAEYRAARAAKKHAVFLGIQGGNALDHDADATSALADGTILRVTLVHLSTSSLGATSSPLRLGKDAGLTAKGKAFVERLNQHRVFVDLAHVSKQGFWDALDVADRRQPVIVTHTGVSGVHEHWRNLDDDQLKAIAKRGGTVGIMYQSSFLGESYLGGTAAKIVDHLEHVIKVAGEDCASLGSDWDGAILPPRDMPTCLELPKLVQIMLDRKFSEQRIKKVLGKNFLRVVETLRG